MIKNTARIDTIYPHLTLQNKQSESSLSFTLANLQFACQLTKISTAPRPPESARDLCGQDVAANISINDKNILTINIAGSIFRISQGHLTPEVK